MARGSDIKARLGLDSKGAEQALDRFTGKLSGLGKVKGPLMAAGAIAAVGTAAAVAGAKAFQATAQLELGANKIAVVFGKNLPQITKWADSVRLSMGTTRQETLMLAAGFQDLLVPMGFSREEAARLTTETVGLSAALSEWSGGTKTAAEIASIFSKAMLGEREQMKTLGISITELDVKTKLLARGQEKLTGNALAQAKAIATQELIFEKSTDAQEAFRKGGDSLARTQQALIATISQMKEDLLVSLIPAMVQLGDVLREDVLPQLEKLGEWFGTELPNKIATTAQAIKDLTALYKLATVQGDDLRESEKIRASQMGIDMMERVARTTGVGIMDSNLEKLTGFSFMDVFIDKVDSMTEPALAAAVELEGLTDQTQKLAEMSALAKSEQAKYKDTVIETATEIAQNYINIAQMQSDQLLGIGELFKEELGKVEEEIAAGQEALNERLADGQRSYQDDIMGAMVSGETQRLDFLKRNNKKIEDNVVKMIDAMKAAGFTNADIARVDIYGKVIDRMWKTHQDGIEAAKQAEDELAAKRQAELNAMSRNNIALVQAMHESWVQGGMEGIFDPTQQFDISGNLVDIPSYHSGGRIGGPIGQETPIMALGGETVLPIGASQGVTINFNGLVAGDPVAIGREIAEIVNKSSRANGAIINGSAVTS